MLEVYAIAGGDWLRGNLNAIAAFMGTGTWSTIEKMCIAISVLIVAGNWVKKHNVMDLLGWVFSLTLVSMLVVIRTPVQIIDYSNVAQVYEVDNGHCCKVSDEAAFCLIQRPYISKTLLT
ncbi:conjugal transfer protein TraG N-terminal domain-containing protein, partial [Klebsiella pneumoniae]|uniref:conjugal transfer protein TraG N-terminal domain-containing protein n=1 Tax=Klebsiella pneumoniae TaxID=573 RepID=UPI001D0ECC26